MVISHLHHVSFPGDLPCVFPPPTSQHLPAKNPPSKSHLAAEASTRYLLHGNVGARKPPFFHLRHPPKLGCFCFAEDLGSFFVRFWGSYLSNLGCYSANLHRPKASSARICQSCRVLKGPGGCVQGEGVFLGNHKNCVWEDWGTLGKIRGITTRDP